MLILSSILVQENLRAEDDIRGRMVLNWKDISGDLLLIFMLQMYPPRRDILLWDVDENGTSQSQIKNSKGYGLAYSIVDLFRFTVF